MAELIRTKLNGNDWKYKCDPYDRGEKEKWYDPNNCKELWGKADDCRLPQCWNTLRKRGVLLYDRYEGVFWFLKRFLMREMESDSQYLMRFKGVNYRCQVWVNGRFIGRHEGGFLPFELEVSAEHLKHDNVIVVRVDNSRSISGIPSLVYDWHNWGGIYRDIEFLAVHKKRILSVQVRATDIAENSARLVVELKANASGPIEWQIVEGSKVVLEGKAQTRRGTCIIPINVNNPKLWSLDSPNLYELHTQLVGKGERVRTRFGIRSIEVRADGIYLNKRRIRIRGVNLHEELMPYGRVIPKEERLKDLERIKGLGFNAVRTAHYPHDESLIELADQVGILILEEIPVYWHCDFQNASVQRLAIGMLRDLIRRDFNHPSVILWSMGNEVPIEDRTCYNFIYRMLRFAKMLDPSRIVTYASNRMLYDPLRKKTDLPCLNEYFGWYYLSERDLNLFIDMIHGIDTAHPLLITEFGADAKFGFHSKNMRKYSEEKQASIVAHSIEILNSKDYVAGWFIWLYRDFRSPLRTNKYQQGYNRKGIISEKNKSKTIAKLISRAGSRASKKRNFRNLGKFSLILRYAELFVVGIVLSFMQKFRNTHKLDNYYSRIATVDKTLKEKSPAS